MHDKICDKTKEHTRGDHWGMSYGFGADRFNRSSWKGEQNNSKPLCLD